MSPPPPTIASTKPARPEAKVTSIQSMAAIVSDISAKKRHPKVPL